MVELYIRHLEFGAGELVIGVGDIFTLRLFYPELDRKGSWRLLPG